MELHLRLPAVLLGPSREAVLVHRFLPGDTAVHLRVGSFLFAAPRGKSIALLSVGHVMTTELRPSRRPTVCSHDEVSLS